MGPSRSYERAYRSRPPPGLGRYGTPFPGAHGYPAARWGWGPIGWTGWDADVWNAAAYDRELRGPPRRLRQWQPPAPRYDRELRLRPRHR